MSIHVTVTGNPVYLGRGKLLLTDIETAKKNEWLRRRKIRLQQARQQAKDLSQNVRKKVSFLEKDLEENEEEEKIKEQNKIQSDQIVSLENEYQASVSSIGTGHQLASIQRECEALEREKKDFRETIAKARGVIAEERLKAEKIIKKEKTQATIERRQMARKFENLRSALVSKQPEPKPSTSQSKKAVAHQKSGALEEVGLNNRKIVSPTKRFAPGCCRPVTRSSLSPPRSKKEHLCKRQKPSKATDEENLGEEESDDSDVTWPPRSVRVTKEPLLPPEPPRIRFYDHNTRVVKSDPRPAYSITSVDPFEDPDMTETIAEEEEAIVRKENLDVLARRERMIRGNKALKKERLRKEAEKFFKELKEMQRKEKIQIAVNKSYPSDFHVRDIKKREVDTKKLPETMKHLKSEDFAISPPLSTSPLSNGPKFKSCYLETADQQKGQESPKNAKHDSSTDNEDFFEELISKLKVERAKKQHQLESKSGTRDITETDVPKWINCQDMTEDAGPSGIKVTPMKQDRAISPVNYDVKESCSCSFRCTCIQSGGVQREQNELIRSTSPKFTTSGDVKHEKSKDSKRSSISPRGAGETAISMQKDHNDQCDSQTVSMPLNSSIVESEGEKVSSKSSSSQSDAVESSLTFEGIKVTVKVSEKNKKKKNRLSREQDRQVADKDIQTSLEASEESPMNRNMSWNNRFSNSDAPSSGSTSYMSPPNRLSPAHQSLLRAILNKIDARNKNPRLHHYIKRVLEMSRKSIDELPVSSVSDVSVSSSIFEHSMKRGSLKSLDRDQPYKKCNVSCQAEITCSDDSAVREEALKFSELAENYALRLQDLAGMMEKMRILPDASRSKDVGEDSSAYLSPPSNVRHSVRLSQSVVPGVYPHYTCDDSSCIRERSLSPRLDLPPAHIHPHPSIAAHHLPPGPATHARHQHGKGSAVGHELSTIQEGGESQRPETPQFDLDISSIRGSPQQQQERRDSTGSSLCLLDDRDISSWLGSSDDYEEVFRSLGIGWALPTVRKTRQSKRRGSGSSRSSGKGQYSHSTPLGHSPAKAHGRTISTDSDSLTPPTLSLNIPQSVWRPPRDCK